MRRIPCSTVLCREQYTETSVQHAAESRPGGVVDSQLLPRRVEGYWNQTGLNREFNKLSKLLEGIY